MLDVFMALLAAGLNAAAAPVADKPSQASIAPPSFPAPVAPADDTVAPPVFLAPAAPVEEAVVPPAFLSPAAPGLVAEPQVATGRFTTALEVKPILNATRGNWVALRDYDGQDLVYVTHLWSWRCGLLELRIGINGQPPVPWPLPDCHMDQAMPAAILESDGLPYRTFGAGTVQTLEVQIIYDDLDTDGATFQRAAILIP